MGELVYEDQKATVNDFQIGPVTQKLYDTLTGIQWGTMEDPYGWIYRVD